MVAILVVLTILACIGIDAAIQFSTARRRREMVSPATNPLAGFTLQGVSLPEGLFVDPAHTWVAVNTNGKTRIGLDQFILKAVGRIDEILTPEAGKEIHRGETLFTVRQGDRKIDIPAPIDGIVDTINEQVAAHAETVKLNPYDEGWICSLTPLRLATNLKKLSIAEEAMDWIQAEIQRFQEFVSLRPVNHLALGTVMQDGGLPTEGVLELMDNETWNLFSFEFVRVHAGH